MIFIDRMVVRLIDGVDSAAEDAHDRNLLVIISLLLAHLGRSDIVIELDFAKIRMVRHLSHLIQNSIHERVKVLHDF